MLAPLTRLKQQQSLAESLTVPPYRRKTARHGGTVIVFLKGFGLGVDGKLLSASGAGRDDPCGGLLLEGVIAAKLGDRDLNGIHIPQPQRI